MKPACYHILTFVYNSFWIRSATFCYVYVCDFPSGHRALPGTGRCHGNDLAGRNFDKGGLIEVQLRTWGIPQDVGVAGSRGCID